MKIRYKNTATNKFISYCFFIVGITYFIFYFVSGFKYYRLVPISLINTFIGCLYYFIDHWNYIVINDNNLCIKTNLFFYIKIPISSITHIEYDFDVICIDYGTKKKYLYFKYISSNDIKSLERFFVQSNLLLPSDSFKTVQFNISNY